MILASRKTPQAAAALAFDGAVGGGLWIFAEMSQVGQKLTFAKVLCSGYLLLLGFDLMLENHRILLILDLGYSG